MLNKYLYAKTGKMINACIFNKNGELFGCVTDEAIQQFFDTFNAINKKAEQLGYMEMFFPISQIMKKMLYNSYENCSADYLNCLKLISQKHRYQLPLELSQIISRNYHDLLKYCCSNSIKDYVFNETVNILRENEIIYQGKDIQGVEDNECAFEYKGIIIGIKIAEKSDLYAMWSNREYECQAIIYAGDRKYLIIENSFEVLMLAIKACIDDYKQEDEKIPELRLDEFSKELLLLADMLYKGIAK